jgi:hypothetical protein
MKKILLLTILFTIVSQGWAQKHSVGLIASNNTKAFKGYNLLYPHEQPNVYLLDNCGRIVQTWTDTIDSRPGNTVYLLEDGSIIKTKRSAKVTGNPIWSGGGGGTVEKRDWNNTLLWTFTLNDSFNRLHHDVEPMPNGNILMISWEKKTKAQAISKGRNPAYLANNEIWPDKIIEVKPLGADKFNIVWEWHLWDHVIQNFDSTKPNYGNPKDFPGKVDLNYANLSSAKNWAFLNAISYNYGYDQIVVSSPSFDEIWVIDHSTTSAEAATSNGGFGKKGGDLLYRWGNPAAYGTGTIADKKLFFPHDIHWMGKNWGEKDFGKLMVFNNRAGSNYSTVNIFQPTFDTYMWQYQKNNGKYLPNTYSWIYKRPDSTSMFSSGLSSVQRLANGNTLICSAQQGYTFEITPTEEIVWEYITPLKLGARVSQGDTTLNVADNNTFRVARYASDFSAFTGKDLSPKGFIELNPDTFFCEISASISSFRETESLKVFPNPTTKLFMIPIVAYSEQKVEIFNNIGQAMKFSFKTKSNNYLEIDIENFSKGIYSIVLNGHFLQTIVKE